MAKAQKQYDRTLAERLITEKRNTRLELRMPTEAHDILFMMSNIRKSKGLRYSSMADIILLAIAYYYDNAEWQDFLVSNAE